ncbi:MAG: UbiA prenyltransferase family protein [Anaerolineaceae bacterium]|jgi:1,4-dihydroxy-2-naphthoate octaprenyltransferase|nr:MAG: hypothetical protein CVU46_05700 [Chloroflexi bacterium HGW-Chloroflexi-8]
MDETKQISKIIIDSSRIPLLGGAILSYLVGTGFVSYVGRNVNWLLFGLGLGIVILFLMGSEYLSMFFYLNQPRPEFELNFRTKLKNSFFQLGLTVLSVGAVVTFFMFFFVTNKLEIWIFLALFFILNIILVFPPVEIRNKGYRDLISAINLAVLTPAFAQILQLKELHRSLLLITFPSFFLVIAIFLAFSLEKYASDISNKKLSLMTVMGWKSGMNFHNLFLLMTYFSYGLAAIFGLPFNFLMSALFAFPFSILQFWEMVRIGNGEKPRWKILKLSALASIGILVYFLLFNLWFR